MINFRYHVVSLTAVFLALAVGMVLGTAALNGPVTEDLYSEAQSLRKSNGQLRDQIAVMEDELATREEYVKEAAPLLLD
ncbi:MAG: copper transporter, partial [Micromonosporaceae bacterium]